MTDSSKKAFAGHKKLEKNVTLLAAVTFVTVGITPSMTKALFAPSEFACPGAAKVNEASLPTPSLMVPLFKASELMAT